MAKGQKRSNREAKKPKKTLAERAAKTTAAATVMAAPGKPMKDAKKKR